MTNKIEVKSSGYDWKIGLKKFGIDFAAVVLAGVASIYGDNATYLAIAPLLKFILNMLKHKYGIVLVK